jgi:hypothetical protein
MILSAPALKDEFISHTPFPPYRSPEKGSLYGNSVSFL